MDTIELFKTDQGWMARFSGLCEREIVRLFQTNVIPTPFTVDANAYDVLSEIAKRNPDANVVLVD
jgi:hypothetical protein